MLKNKSVKKGIFKILTGVIVGGAIGSILGLTLAPRKGEESRRMLREKSMEMFLHGKAQIKEGKKVGPVKRIIIRLLTPKNRQ